MRRRAWPARRRVSSRHGGSSDRRDRGPRRRLRSILGVGFGLGVSVGGTLGVGILRAPGAIAARLHAPSVILGIWLAGGLYTLLVAICLTELGTMVPQDGGYCVYARRAFGDWIGLAVGWTDWITSCAVLGYLSIAMAEFLAALVPGVAGATRPIAVAILVGFVALQWAGVRISSCSRSGPPRHRWHQQVYVRGEHIYLPSPTNVGWQPRRPADRSPRAVVRRLGGPAGESRPGEPQRTAAWATSGFRLSHTSILRHCVFSSL